RADARVLVVGAGRVGAPLAAALGVAGIGTVDVLDDGAAGATDAGVGGLDLSDVGRSRGEAARERLRAAVPSAPAGPVPRPDLVVLAPSRPEHLEEARRQVEPSAPHLLAEVRETVGVVGPLVLPGRSACLRCLDLTRTDLDPDWPALAAQLAAPSGARVACDGPLALMVAAQAALQVLALVDGTTYPAAVGGTLELALPDWRWRRRTWPVHPDCGCVLPATG
ncbi:MAG TPA: ThiF family adenylyltransferase, partial [Pilimelia sp.]|nr:ThiF family adenylyltransferase [Pilimelia sp.]